MSTRLNNSEAKTLKSKARPPFTPPPESVPSVLDGTSIPFNVVRVKSGPKPRSVIWRPSPPSREIATPGTRCNDSAIFRSGNLPMSSLSMVSFEVTALRFSNNARFSAPRKPLTSMIS